MASLILEMEVSGESKRMGKFFFFFPFKYSLAGSLAGWATSAVTTKLFTLLIFFIHTEHS